MKIMVAPNALGGMRSVVEAYERDGFLTRESVRVIHSYGEGSFFFRQMVLLKALAIYVSLFVFNRIDLVHVHSAMRGSFWRKAIFSTIARIFGCPILLHLHGSEMKPFYASQNSFMKRLVRIQLEKASSVLVLSQSWADFVLEVAPNANIAIVPNYVSIPPGPEVDKRDGKTVLFLGLVGPRKGSFDLIDAFEEVHRQHPESRLVIGGNGDLQEARRRIEARGLGEVIQLAGWVGETKKRALLERASIYVLPSYNEGLPMSVLEAMAAGLPVVTTGVGGVPELITNGVDGLLINPGDKIALGQAIHILLADPQLRQRIANAGRRRIIEGFSAASILPLLHNIYGKNARRRLNTGITQ